MNDRIRRLLERLADDRGGTIPPSTPDSQAKRDAMPRDTATRS